jgi:hypothetical protein
MQAYMDTEELASYKRDKVSHKGDFIRTAEERFTRYYQPLIPWVNRLRKIGFQMVGDGKGWTGIMCSNEEDHQRSSKPRNDPKITIEG